MYIARQHSELYVEDQPNVVPPFFGVSIAKQKFLFSHDIPRGTKQYCSVFCYIDVQQDRLLRKIEEGKVVFLDHPGRAFTYNGDILSHSHSPQRMMQVAARLRSKRKKECGTLLFVYS
ncbi:hypothetical protein [Grimontia marina]|uniref:Uncharacterized protein n=1 Tax=Grimontia marina TaxID=646534 RepID=A0A128FHL7_9GAMM|nr:hypothetical protein [Grimontia marina]CZF85794.1 hypothetical protein GMA8713_03827 [Grimontia marina]